MRALKLLGSLAAVALLHFVGTRLWPRWPAAVDLFLVVAVLHALDGRLLAALVAGLAAGLATDALTGGLFGLYGFADTLVAYVAAYAARRLVIRRAAGVFLVCAVAAAVQQGLVAGLLSVLLSDPELPPPFWSGLRIAISGLLGVVLHAVGERLAARARRRGKRRSRRLGMRP